MNIFFSKPNYGISPKLKKIKDLIFCVLIISLGAILRIYHYDSIPTRNWTADEYGFAWCGMSLIQEGSPTSWSLLGSYRTNTRRVFWKDFNYRLVNPYFDHPPLFSLIVGAASIIGGANNLFDCSLADIRIPSLIFGISSILILYILSRLLFGTGVAVIASLIFATNPSLVFLSRLAVSENFILFLALAMLLCFLKYSKTSKPFYLYISIILAGMASLSKVTGLFLALLLFLLLIYQRKWIKAVFALGGSLLIFSIFFIYGWIYNFNLFMDILLEESRQFINILIFKNIIFQTGIVPFFDAWVALSWLVLISVVMSTKNKIKAQIISLPIIIYLLTLLFTGAQSHFYQWYYIPFYPFLSLVLGIFFYKLMKKPDFLSISLMLIFTGVWSIHYIFLDQSWSIFSLYNLDGFKYLFISIISLILASFFLYSLNPNEKTKRLTNIVAITLFIFFVITNIIIICKFPVVLTRPYQLKFTI